MAWISGDIINGKYEIIREIGRGGFGVTYLARFVTMGNLCVIKIPITHLLNEENKHKLNARFQKESIIIARISHPNIVQYIDLFTYDNLPCLVMEYIEGETLNSVILREGPFSEEESLKYFRQLASALKLIHENGLIHCDISPHNILLRPITSQTVEKFEAVLIDFGSTKNFLSLTRTVTSTVNAAFSPYEQSVTQSEIRPTSDIYSLTACLYFALTGKIPQSALEMKLYSNSLISPKVYKPNMSEWLCHTILSGMALEPHDRVQSMEEWGNMLYPRKVKNSLIAKNFPSVKLGILIASWMLCGFWLPLLKVSLFNSTLVTILLFLLLFLSMSGAWLNSKLLSKLVGNLLFNKYYILFGYCLGYIIFLLSISFFNRTSLSSFISFYFPLIGLLQSTLLIYGSLLASVELRKVYSSWRVFLLSMIGSMSGGCIGYMIGNFISFNFSIHI
jgi:serine/threonine protein kinase